jgi:hypothetical protein
LIKQRKTDGYSDYDFKIQEDYVEDTEVLLDFDLLMSKVKNLETEEVNGQ